MAKPQSSRRENKNNQWVGQRTIRILGIRISGPQEDIASNWDIGLRNQNRVPRIRGSKKQGK